MLAIAATAQHARAAEAPRTDDIDLAGHLLDPWTGDLDAMIADGSIRVLVTFSHTNYFIVDGRPRGLSYEMGQAFEKFIRERYDVPRTGFDVVYVPVDRDELLPFLIQGRGDLAVALLSVTPERQKVVDFSPPLGTGIREFVITNRDAPPVAQLEDLAGRELWVHRSSSYAENLDQLAGRLAASGLPPMDIHEIEDHLETEDVLEMVNAGLIPATVADGHLADLWTQFFPNLVVHREAPLVEDVSIAWAHRKQSPQLAAALAAFVPTVRKGTLLGNVLSKRYLGTNKWARRAVSSSGERRFHDMIHLFETYGDRYGFSELLLAAQGYQESGLDQSRRSQAGAIGVMQLLPTTAASPEVGIPDIEVLDNNIHAGAKYMRWLVDKHFDEPGLDPLNRHLFALAAYNAGPGRIGRLRKEAAERGIDPNRWFNQVEVVVAQRVGREPVQYVRNIFKYYLAYQRVTERAAQRGQTARPSETEAGATP